MFNNRFPNNLIFGKINEYLIKIIQNYAGISITTQTDLPDIGIFQDSQLGETFWSQNLSDGTLRAIAILVILFQNNFSKDQNFLVFGIEEPELALHPAATSVLLDAMREASQETQVLVTTHSPDLLDNVDLENGDELVLAVDSRDGRTIIAPIDSASREIVKENLFSLGDLLRMRQLEPEIVQPKEHV
jgi:predicted ATPase